MKNLYYKLIILSLTIFLGIISCDNNSEDKKIDISNNNLKSNKNSLIENNNIKIENKNPKINNTSRFAFTYKSNELDKIYIYNKINGENHSFELKNNINVWINLTKNKLWYQVIMDNDKWGYIKKSNIKLYPRAKINIKQGNLNLREGKGINTKIIEGLPKNTIVYVIDINDSEWYKIRNLNGKIGYTASKYLKFIDSKNTISNGIEQKEFFTKYFQLTEDEYLLLMKDYKFLAVNKYMIMGDFNNAGRLDKAFFTMKKGDDNYLFLVVWHSESNMYIIVEKIPMPSFLGLEFYPKDEKIKNIYEGIKVEIIGDRIGLVSFDKGSVIIYYWTGNNYKSYIYNE